MNLDVLNDSAATEVGSYFVSNYPPFSVWSKSHVPSAIERLGCPLGEVNGEVRDELKNNK